MEFTHQAESQLEFGGQTSRLSLNELARPGNEGQLAIVSQKLLDGLTSDSPCRQLGAIVETTIASNPLMDYTELQNCNFEQFGYVLKAGRWPSAPNEVALSDKLPFSVGGFISGVAPKRLHVVGQVTNLNLTSSAVLLAAPGTWTSWDMAVNSKKYPRLTASYSLDFNTEYPLKVQARLTALAQTSPEAATSEFSDFRQPKTSLIDRFPYLFKWLLWPLALAGSASSLFFRRRQLTSTRLILLENGLNKVTANSAVMASSSFWLTVLTQVAAVFGWLVAWGSAPLVVLATGHAAPGSNPFPVQVCSAFAMSTLLSALLLVFAKESPNPAREANPNKSRKSVKQGHKAKFVIGFLTLIAVIAYFPQMRTVEGLFGNIFAVLFLATWFTPNLTSLAVRIHKSSKLSSVYAARGMAKPSSKSWMTMASAIIAFGPFISLSILISSTASFAYENQILPPLTRQALFYPSGDQSQDNKVLKLVANAIPNSAQVVRSFIPQGQAQEEIVSTGSGFGAVGAVRSPHDLALILGKKLSNTAVNTLNEGGVVWLRPDLDSRIWELSQSGNKALQTKSSTYFPADKRWSNDTAGFMLTSTSKKIGLVNQLNVYVINGLTTSAKTRITDALIAAGFNANYIRFWNGDRGTDVTPFQLALGSILGIVGLVLLLVSLRGNLARLKETSRNLILLGIPAAWFRKVFAIETGLPTLIGGAVGIVLPLLLVNFGTQFLGIPMVVPFEVIAGYLGLIVSAYAVVLAVNSRRFVRAA